MGKKFSQKIASSYAEYGLSQQQSLDFIAAYDAYASEMRIASAPSTRTKVAVSQKNDLRAAVRSIAGTLNKIVQANPNVSDAQRIGLGLAIARPRVRIGRPDTVPSIHVASVSGHTVRITWQQYDGESFSSRKPRGTAAALVMGYVNDRPEPDISKYHLVGIASRSSLTITFPVTPAPGTKVWLGARWLNNRKETGPASSPISTNLPGGSVGETSMRIAA